jgi:pseudouridine synthase
MTIMATEERVQKILAKAGIASRRKAEELITEGSVTINGKVAQLGDKATFGKDAIKVNGKLLQGVEPPIYIAFYKPKGVISMMVDNEARPTLADYLQKITQRVFPVGRLDFMSEGLILLTNDGDFAEKMQRRDDVPRVYRIKVKGHMTDEMVARLSKGAKLENRMAKPHSVRVVKELESKSQVDVVMLGGGAIDIKAMCEMKGFLVDKITRTAIGHITLHGLVPGGYRVLKSTQAQALLDHPELGMKRIEHEVEAAKPKGQRTHHAKKVVQPLSAPAAAPSPGKPASPRATVGGKPALRKAAGNVVRPLSGPRAPSANQPKRDPLGRPPRPGFGRTGASSFKPREERGPRRDDRAPRPERGGFGVFKPRADRPQRGGGASSVKPRRK